jgi:hypothetical protein
MGGGGGGGGEGEGRIWVVLLHHYIRAYKPALGFLCICTTTAQYLSMCLGHGKGLTTTLDVNKGNNKITELRTILQRESQNS